MNVDIEEKESKLEDIKSIQTKLDKMKTLRTQIETKNKQLQSEIEFFNKHDNCPTCKQELDDDFKLLQVAELVTTKNEVEDGFFDDVEKLLQLLILMAQMISF